MASRTGPNLHLDSTLDGRHWTSPFKKAPWVRRSPLKDIQSFVPPRCQTSPEPKLTDRPRKPRKPSLSADVNDLKPRRLTYDSSTSRPHSFSNFRDTDLNSSSSETSSPDATPCPKREAPTPQPTSTERNPPPQTPHSIANLLPDFDWSLYTPRLPPGAVEALSALVSRAFTASVESSFSVLSSLIDKSVDLLALKSEIYIAVKDNTGESGEQAPLLEAEDFTSAEHTPQPSVDTSSLPPSDSQSLLSGAHSSASPPDSPTDLLITAASAVNMAQQAAIDKLKAKCFSLEEQVQASPSDHTQKDYRITHKSIGYLKPSLGKLYDAMENDTYTRPLAWLRHLSIKINAKDDLTYKAKVLEVASECLLGRALMWWTAIGDNMRTILMSDFTLQTWFTHIQILCPSKDQMRQDAIDRAWVSGKESCLDYVWDKAAMFAELDEIDRPKGQALMSAILKGLPASLSRMSRIEFSPNPGVDDLCKELQIILPKWEREMSENKSYTRNNAGIKSIPSQAQRTGPSRAPESLNVSYDKSKIDHKPHPKTMKLTRTYTKPNGRILYLTRNCRKCDKEHFDFEHDSLASKGEVHLVVTEDGYEEWPGMDSGDKSNEDLLDMKLN
ncbi:hypothetical protein DFH27DRAFT_609829 [Peziza echinospora]|nr:hypothetical protein DFH27DRAFT_609829 [Peziza echinospora]